MCWASSPHLVGWVSANGQNTCLQTLVTGRVLSAWGVPRPSPAQGGGLGVIVAQKQVVLLRWQTIFAGPPCTVLDLQSSDYSGLGPPSPEPTESSNNGVCSLQAWLGGPSP